MESVLVEWTTYDFLLLASVEVSGTILVIEWGMAELIELKHWIIAAKLGEENGASYAAGFVSKEDFIIRALRAHQDDAVEETKSQQREAAEAARKNRVK